MEKRNQSLLVITVLELVVVLLGYVIFHKEGFIIAIIWSVSSYISYILFSMLITIKPKSHPTLIVIIELMLITAILMALILSSAVVANIRDMQSAAYVYIALIGILIGFIVAMIIGIASKRKID